MGKRKKRKERPRKGKKKHRNRTPSKKWEKYKGEKKARFCPKCGPGVFLGIHSNRLSCGRCGYTEFIKSN